MTMIEFTSTKSDHQRNETEYSKLFFGGRWPSRENLSAAGRIVGGARTCVHVCVHVLHSNTCGTRLFPVLAIFALGLD